MSSKRGYLTVAELEEFADISVSNEAEAYDQISQAEELIDRWVGPQNKAVTAVFVGKLTAVAGSVLTDTSSDTQLDVTDNYFQGCVIEIISGTGSGQIGRIVSSSSTNKSVTLSEDLSTAPDATSVYKIYQLAKFPRDTDRVTLDNVYYSTVPDAVRRATAAQVQYAISQGSAFFASDSPMVESESIGNYSYSKSAGASSFSKLIAPRAKTLLRGIINRTGELIA